MVAVGTVVHRARRIKPVKCVVTVQRAFAYFNAVYHINSGFVVACGQSQLPVVVQIYDIANKRIGVANVGGQTYTGTFVKYAYSGYSTAALWRLIVEYGKFGIAAK